MAISYRVLTIAVVSVAAAMTATLACAQSDADRSIEQYSCKDIMRDSGREVAIAFLHGYLIGKSGNSKFNLVTLEKQTDAFIEYCLDHPADKAEAAMLQSKK